ncbi:MAG: histidinol-phosphatase [Clostridia bacterium]|nr:histidinol-phosphatase [Clostridia bacterium]
MLYNFHTHTTYCDGKSTAEEMIQKAIELGFSKLGFSGHSYTEFDLEPCMTREGTEEYKKEIIRLKEKYKDKIEIFLGIEYDYHSVEPMDGYDYILGSVHYLFKDGEYLCIDYSRQVQIDAVNKHYGGDYYAYIEDYYNTVADLYNKLKCDVIGHFDLITKYNADGSLFDVNHPRYIAAWKKAADAIIKTPAVVEINTGGMARGHVNHPYPSKEIIDYFKQNGKKLIFSSDCHNKDFLLYGYDDVKEYL